MDLTPLLGTSFDCNCGKRHHIPTEHIFYGKDAFSNLAKTAASIASGPNYLILADNRTWKAAGKNVLNHLQSRNTTVSTFIVPDRNNAEPAADDRTKDFILDHCPEADLYLAVGSGVINDLVKWVAFLRSKPYLTIPTAASMNGYGSANVAATVKGLKVLFHADACRAVFADPQIINNAPGDMTTSGLGDVLAKSVSSADWKLNQFLFDDYYCQYSVDLLKDLEPVYLENPGKIRDKDPQALRALFEALLYSSIAMTITGTSSPASGGEHLISHTLDMLALRDNRRHDLHGRQVGVGSILTAALYEKVMAVDSPEFCEVPSQVNHHFWGSLSPVVEKEYRKKLERMDSTVSFLSSPANWARLKQQIGPSLVPAQKLKDCLKLAGGAHRFHDIRDNGESLGREKFLNIAMHANQMRQRFTILDLAVMLGVSQENYEDIINQWLSR